MTMAREVLLKRYRTIIGDDRIFGDRMMNIAGQMFEKFCIPGKETMPDDDVLFQTAYDDASALWSQIRSVQAQAAERTTHHDYADAVVTTLIATAFVLEDRPVDSEEYVEFVNTFGFSPVQALEWWR